MDKLIKLPLILLMALSTVSAFSQAGNTWLDNEMFQSGKINVVVAVLAVLFIILFIYLFRIDRRLKKVEEENN